jgi:hypothetical protein
MSKPRNPSELEEAGERQWLRSEQTLIGAVALMTRVRDTAERCAASRKPRRPGTGVRGFADLAAWDLRDR